MNNSGDVNVVLGSIMTVIGVAACFVPGAQGLGGMLVMSGVSSIAGGISQNQAMTDSQKLAEEQARQAYEQSRLISAAQTQFSVELQDAQNKYSEAISEANRIADNDYLRASSLYDENYASRQRGLVYGSENYGFKHTDQSIYDKPVRQQPDTEAAKKELDSTIKQSQAKLDSAISAAGPKGNSPSQSRGR